MKDFSFREKKGLSSQHKKEEKKERLISTLKRRGYVSGEELGKELSLSRSGVWKMINSLRKLGFVIDGCPKKGYTLCRLPDMLHPILFKDELSTEVVGKHIFYFEITDSTNEFAKELALKGEVEGTVVVSEHQRSGKGRLGRKWVSKKGKNILFSVIFRPKIPVERVAYLTMICSLAIVSSLKRLFCIDVGIKWPNDIYYKGKKLCGILTEFGAEQGRLNYAVVGAGINVNMNPSEFPDIRDTATSLCEILGKEIERISLFKEILCEIDKEYLNLKKEQFQDIIFRWKSLSTILGRKVCVDTGEKTVKGLAFDFFDDGSLILKRDDGEFEKVFFGDVTLKSF